MKFVVNTAHAAHAALHEFFRGRLVPSFETPARAEVIAQALREAGWFDGESLPTRDHGRAPLERVHAPAYLHFLEGAWDERLAAGGDADGDAFPAVWPVRSLRHDVVPRDFVARLGLYSMDSGTPLTAGSWAAAYGGAQAALTALDAVLAGERAAYVLTRPPGHHAGYDFFGGYCFVNQAAVAAQAALDAGMRRVAILDVDYHHGNGTQAIFYARRDVFFASLHGDPMTEYPFYLGHADERGDCEGLGFNANFPLAAGATNEQWFAALHAALERLRIYDPELLIVSLGVDTYVGDPISHFRLDVPEYTRLGGQIERLDRPTLIVQEGGYATAEIGRNVLAVLRGFDDSSDAAS
jgi:acetoin utilization deacetylase AcuC-like enzyme